MSTFFTSDHHFGHRNISRLAGRPFLHTDDGVIAMNELMIERWNGVVRDGDTVVILGDFALGQIADTLPVVGRLNGTKHLIAGNHDRCSPAYYKTPAPHKVEDWTQRYLDAGFSSVGHSGTTSVAEISAVSPNRAGVALSHWPYIGDSHRDDRYVDYRPVDDGGWLIHGHVHEAWRQRGRQINVGVDAWNGFPVSAGEIAELIAAGPQQVGPLPWL